MKVANVKYWAEVGYLRIKGLVRVPVFLTAVGGLLLGFYMFLTLNRAYFGYQIPRVVVGELALSHAESTAVIGFFGMLVSAFLAYKTA